MHVLFFDPLSCQPHFCAVSTVATKRNHRSNEAIADTFDEIADILELKQANPFRIMSYRRAANRIRELREPIARLYARRGAEGLRDLEGIGERLSGSIAELVETGRLGMLTRLRAELSPEEAFSRLPGIGEILAGRIVDELNVESLEELERAVYDGRLEEVSGIGPVKATGVGHALAGILNRGARRQARQRLAPSKPQEPPSVALLLSLDMEYRERVRAGRLRRIAPRRFNPDNERWLPILEVQREGRHFTLLFSNTRRAHELGRTHDWVIIYVDDDGGFQYTVVTATSGLLRDKRVVRGLEAQCRRYYERRSRHRPTARF